MSASQAQLLTGDELTTQALMALPLGTWLSNGRRAYRLVRHWPGRNELTLESPLGEFRTTPEKIARSGYHPVKQKPRKRQEGL